MYAVASPSVRYTVPKYTVGQTVSLCPSQFWNLVTSGTHLDSVQIANRYVAFDQAFATLRFSRRREPLWFARAPQFRASSSTIIIGVPLCSKGVRVGSTFDDSAVSVGFIPAPPAAAPSVPTLSH